MSRADKSQDRRHEINKGLLKTLDYKLRKRFWVTMLMIVLFFYLLAILSGGILGMVELTGGWKDILNIMLGAYLATFAKVINFWFDSSKDDSKIQYGMVISSRGFSPECQIVIDQAVTSKSPGRRSA